MASVRFFQLLQPSGTRCSAGEGEARTGWGPSRRDAVQVTLCTQGRGSAAAEYNLLIGTSFGRNHHWQGSGVSSGAPGEVCHTSWVVSRRQHSP